MTQTHHSEHTEPSLEQAEEVNAGIQYAMYSVFRVASPLPDEREGLAAQIQKVLDDAALEGVTVRGIYDVSGFRADADFMIWWHAPRVEALQGAYQAIRRTDVGRHLEPVWSQMAIHRPAEFNRGHIPAFLSGEPAQAYICVYPFVRSYEWYLMDEGERRDMLREHGMAAKDYKDIRANTLASFALGDYEWILAFEAAELHRIVDLMRELRNTRARLHVREELPFYTGPLVSVEKLVSTLP